MGRKRGSRAKTSDMSCLEMAKKDLKAAFFEGEKAGIKPTGRSFNSYADYEKTMETMLNGLAKFVGEDGKELLPRYMKGGTWDRYFEHLIGSYQRGEMSAHTIQKRVDALEGFRQMVNQTNVCGKDTKIRTGNVQERREMLLERGVIRSLDDITAIKPTRAESDAVHKHFNIKTENGRLSQTINKLQEECGGRIRSMFKLKVEDVDFAKNTITFNKDKGGFTRTVPLTAEARAILEPFCKGKKDGTPVIIMKNQEGNRMSIQQAVKTVQGYTNRAAVKADVNREDRRFTTHSNRKQYAQNLYNKTRTMSSTQLKKAIGDYVNLQGSNKEQIIKRMENEKQRINDWNRKNGKPMRDFTHEHLRRMLISLHLGHSRLDVVRHYITADAHHKKTA